MSPGHQGDDRLVTDVDPVRVREVIANLVTNAMRHTPPGGRVEVESVTDTDDDPDHGRDDRRGHPAPPIWRGSSTATSGGADTGGTGLGLAIVRDLVAAHGGTVEAESDGVPGRGATFRVRLPRRD